MKSILLKISSFRFGAARRHCPFTSIIHKPISIFLVLIIFFLHVILVPVSVEASVLPSGFQPYIRPVYNTTITDLQEAYNSLSGDELTIFLILAGAYVINYAGLGDFGLVFEDPPTDANLKERLEFTGQQLIDTLFLPQNLFNAIFDPILSYLQGCIVKAKSTDIDDFNTDLGGGGGAGHSFGVLLPYDESLILSFNQFFALQSGLFNWQYRSYDWDYEFNWNHQDLSGITLDTYNSYVSQIPTPKTLLNSSKSPIGETNIVCQYPDEKFVLYIDLNNNQIGFRGLNGESLFDINQYTSFRNLKGVYTIGSSSVGKSDSSTLRFQALSFDPSQYTSYKDIVTYFFNNVPSCIIFTGQYSLFRGYCNPLIFFDKVYYGTDFNTKTELTNETDLDLTQSNSGTLEVPKTPTLLDLSAVIEALQGLSTSLADLRTVIFENSYNKNTGAIVVQNDFDLNSLSQLIPESGIVVPEGLFGSSKGFIDYLWYMTKPLVQYTHDFLGTMWFDGVDGFDFSGPAPIVFGVITLGLIGGLIVKFLL